MYLLLSMTEKTPLLQEMARLRQAALGWGLRLKKGGFRPRRHYEIRFKSRTFTHSFCFMVSGRFQKRTNARPVSRLTLRTTAQNKPTLTGSFRNGKVDMAKPQYKNGPAQALARTGPTRGSLNYSA